MKFLLSDAQKPPASHLYAHPPVINQYFTPLLVGANNHSPKSFTFLLVGAIPLWLPYSLFSVIASAARQSLLPLLASRFIGVYLSLFTYPPIPFWSKATSRYIGSHPGLDPGSSINLPPRLRGLIIIVSRQVYLPGQSPQKFPPNYKKTIPLPIYPP